MKLSTTISFLANHPLTKSKPKVILKYIWWQLRTRMASEKPVINWIDDARLRIGRGETGLTGNYYVGLMEYEDMGFLLHYLDQDTVFVDVGANAGVYSVLAAKVKNTASIAFEPIKATFDRMADQLILNEICDSVTAHNMGVGAIAGKLYFTKDNDTTNRVIENVDATSDPVTEVPVTTLDSTLTQDRNYVIKIDVEGFEKQVLDGGEALLASGAIKAIVIELNDSGLSYGVSDQELHETICGHGFSSVVYDPKTRVLKQSNGKNQNNGNTIYVLDPVEAQKKVTAAPRHIIQSAFGAEL